MIGHSLIANIRNAERSVMISDDDLAALQQQVENAPPADRAFAARVAAGPSVQYAGFRIPDLGIRIWLDVIFADGKSARQSPGLEKWLFDRFLAAGGAVNADELKRLNNLFTVRLPPTSASAPAFDPAEWWKNDPHAKCYPYALNVHGYPNAVPGCISCGAQPTFKGCGPIAQGCIHDGLAPWDSGNPPQGDGHFVALFSEPDSDKGVQIHFHRLDANGLWSEKADNDLPTQEDFSGKLVVEPRITQPIDDTIVFCQFFWVPAGLVAPLPKAVKMRH